MKKIKENSMDINTILYIIIAIEILLSAGIMARAVWVTRDGKDHKKSH